MTTALMFLTLVVFGQPATATAPVAGLAEEVQFGPYEGRLRIDWRDARRYMGEEVIVVGRLIQSRQNQGGIVLYFDLPANRSLQIFIRKQSLSLFRDEPDSAYPGKWVEVRGLIDEYRGEPQVIVDSPERIRILAEEDAAAPTATTRPVRADGVVRIGSYNVMNLFDEYDDPYTADEGTRAKPRGEMRQLAGTIRKLDADVLALAEVENRGVLERFVYTWLADMGYEHVVLLEGNDGRGIDCAVLSRLPVGPVTSHRHLRFPLSTGGELRFRRDLLQVRIEPRDAPPFDVYVVHLKSKRGEAEGSAPIRQAEAAKIRSILDDRLRHHPDDRFVLCGDFNDTWDSEPLRTIRGEGDRMLRSFHDERPASEHVTFNREPYRSMIDFILCSPAMARRYVEKSYRVIHGEMERSGSDHNPLSADFKLR